jgi:hypothetical protein
LPERADRHRAKCRAQAVEPRLQRIGGEILVQVRSLIGLLHCAFDAGAVFGPTRPIEAWVFLAHVSPLTLKAIAQKNYLAGGFLDTDVPLTTFPESLFREVSFCAAMRASASMIFSGYAYASVAPGV